MCWDHLKKHDIEMCGECERNPEFKSLKSPRIVSLTIHAVASISDYKSAKEMLAEVEEFASGKGVAFSESEVQHDSTKNGDYFVDANLQFATSGDGQITNDEELMSLVCAGLGHIQKRKEVGSFTILLNED